MKILSYICCLILLLLGLRLGHELLFIQGSDWLNAVMKNFAEIGYPASIAECCLLIAAIFVLRRELIKRKSKGLWYVSTLMIVAYLIDFIVRSLYKFEAINQVSLRLLLFIVSGIEIVGGTAMLAAIMTKRFGFND